MAGNNDAELNVGINDNLTPTLAKMAAQVRAFGNAIGAEAGKVDKAVASVTGAMGRLAGAGTKMPGNQAYARSIAKATENLAKYRAEMERLSHVENAKTNSSGRKYDASTGRLISQKDLDAYDEAKVRAKVYGDELERLNRLQSEMGASRAWQKGGDGLPAHLAAAKAEAEGLTRSTRDLEKLYSNMFGKVEAVNGKATSWWPPEMLRGPQQFTEAMMGMQNSVRYAMYDVSRNLLLGGAALSAFGVGAIVVAAQWERAFADVERTVQGTPQTLDRIHDGLVALSQDIPVGFKDLAEIASIGGQMGINANGIVAYTETIAKLTATTNLTADAASKALGRFKAFFAEASDPSLAVTDQTFGNLASSILKVGVNSVATESGIVGVATQISSMGSYAGLTADQVIGLSGSLSSIGVPPELSRGVITRLFNTIGEAVAENGTKLQDFARLAGVSAEDFAASWGSEEFGYVFTSMISGLGQVASSGGDAVSVLHDLGLTSVRDVPVLLRLATAAGEVGTAGSLLAQTMNDARSGWRQNIELSIQYNKIADTLVERTKVLMQNFEALFATMGQTAVGPVKAMVDGMITLLKGFTALAATPAGQWLGGVSLAAGLLTGALLLLAAGGARAFAAMQGLAQGLTAVGVSSAAATAGVRVLGFTIASIGAIGAIVGVVGTIMALTAASEEAHGAIRDTSGALAAMQEDSKSGSGFALTEGLQGAKDASADLTSQAENMGNVLGFAEDKMYGNASAANAAGQAVETAALRYGKSAAAFARAAVVGSKAFQDLFADTDTMDIGTQFSKALTKGGFDLDKALSIATKDGKRAVEKYINEVLVAGTGASADNPEALAKAFSLYKSSGSELAQILGTTGAQFGSIANAAYASGEAFQVFTSATEMTTDAMEDFKVQNEDAINSMADGFAKFVDTSSLVGLTQQMQAAFAVIDDGSTEVDEHAEAIAGFEQAWTDAYGGASFSIDEYMTIFRRAAGEQQAFVTNLQTLAARGVPTNIIGDLAAMGPQAQSLVEALINSTDDQLNEYVALYGATGFDSMVALAAGQLAAEQIVRNAAATLSTAQLQQLSADLSAGTPLTTAMSKWNLDAQGKPMKAPAEIFLNNPQWYGQYQNWLNQNPLRQSLYINAVTIRSETTDFMGSGGVARPGYAGGGYTGPGGKYQEAGTVHAGEYVFTKEQTDQRSGLPKADVLMRMLNGRIDARRGPSGGGYAAGGYVTGGGASVVHLSVEDRMLLVAIREAVGVTLASSTIATLVNADNTNGTARRSA